MTRPNIVRADTLDLQDQDNPTAAEHSKPPTENGLAPHQRAEVDHVIRERHSEEEALAEAWNVAGSITDEPGAIDQAQQNHDGGSAQQNGEESANSETDNDDDMMDRISSSPSIDDGSYTAPSAPLATSVAATRVVRAQRRPRTVWPVRTSSLSPSPRNTPTPTRETFNQSPLSSPTGSSPFLYTPQHLPLHVRRTGRIASPLQREGLRNSSSSSPFNDSPLHLPMIRVDEPREKLSLQSPSKCHHGMGRYILDPESGDGDPCRHVEQDEGLFNQDRYVRSGSRSHASATATGDAAISKTEHVSEPSPTIHEGRERRLSADIVSRQHAIIRNLDDLASRQLEQSPSFSSIQSLEISDLLLPPVDDPLLDKPLPASPTNSSDDASWETESEHDDLEGECDNDDDDDTDALFLALDDRFVDSGWGGECLRETEDIDFEFVYALHTFVATVEGQANATKGDTMVLLDDSNSYWWLVRVVKDSSIGYLPAEHIETPTERLARLNKHRNIDLSATMLSDNAEKSRNPLKKAMKRRNAKTVQFAAPTYVEASDNDYSSEEEDHGVVEPSAGIVESEKAQQDNKDTDGEARATSEARTAHDTNEHRLSTSSRDSFDREQAATLAQQQNADEPPLSPKLVDKTEAAPLKSRKGTPRNTDSFLKDDNIETIKKTLTPGLLREDGSGKSASSESARNTSSLEGLAKQTSPTESAAKRDGKKEKEKKEKKQGMLSGLFKSKKKDKDRKSKDEVVESESERASKEYARESPRASPAPSGRSSPSQPSPSSTHSSSGLSNDTRRQEVQTRQPAQRSKLTKVQPNGSNTASPNRSPSRGEKPILQPSGLQEEARPPSQLQSRPQQQEPKSSFVAELEGSEAAFEMAAADDVVPQTAPAPAPASQKEGRLSPLTNMLKSSSEPKPAKAKRSKKRVELDDFDSPADEESHNPFKERGERARKGSTEDHAGAGKKESDGLDDSPIEISHNAFMHGTDSIHIPMPGQFEVESEDDSDDDDEGTQKEGERSADSLGSSPSLIERPSSADVSANETENEETEGEDEAETPPGLTKSPSASASAEDEDATPTGPRSPSQSQTHHATAPSRGLSLDSTASTTPSVAHRQPPPRSSSSPVPESEQHEWSDTALRTWLEDGTEVRDMLLLIHDTSGVVPVKEDHPALRGLWVEERKGVGRMMGELDGLLEGFLRGRGARST